METRTPTREDEIVFDMLLKATGLDSEMIPVLAWWWEKNAATGESMKDFLHRKDILNSQALTDIDLVVKGHLQQKTVTLLLTRTNLDTLYEELQHVDLEMNADAVYVEWDAEEASVEKQEQWDAYNAGEFISFSDVAARPGRSSVEEFVSLSDKSPELGRVVIFDAPSMGQKKASEAQVASEQTRSQTRLEARSIFSAAEDLLATLAAS